ncbi:MAG: hypothetical protein ABUL62_02995 [Myxococcales bacterium]|jgi:hypothetical protein
MESRDDLRDKLSLIDRQLRSSDEPTADLIEALLDSARSLNLPLDARQDSFLFAIGEERIEAASWEQCGALVQALEDGSIVDGRELAARVAARISELVPEHYRVTTMPLLR